MNIPFIILLVYLGVCFISYSLIRDEGKPHILSEYAPLFLPWITVIGVSFPVAYFLSGEAQIIVFWIGCVAAGATVILFFVPLLFVIVFWLSPFIQLFNLFRDEERKIDINRIL